MFKVVIEDIGVLFQYLKFPTQPNNDGEIFHERLSFNTLPPPLSHVEISVLTNGYDLEIKAIVYPQVLKIFDPKTKVTKNKAGELFLPNLVSTSNFDIINVTPREFGIKKHDTEIFRIYQNHKYIMLSAGNTLNPSGPRIKIDTIEQFEEDLNIFSEALEELLNCYYTDAMALSLIYIESSKNQAKTMGEESKVEYFEQQYERIRNEYEKSVFNEDRFIYIREPLEKNLMLMDMFMNNNKDRDRDDDDDDDDKSPQAGHIGKVHRLIKPEKIKETLDDVAGIEDQKDQIKEILEFIKNPERFTKLGAEIPKGIMLSGPPGTGKTMLAKAVAKEADIPFFYISGSGFVEIYVGTGAGRVRKLFKDAKRKAPCLIFIDEFDAIGQRGGGQNSERDQTCNEFLTRMEGFDDDPNVVVMAATNRIDMIDSAILSRFGRRITVPNPNVEAREQILMVHTKNKPLENNVNLKSLARATSGFSGRDLRNLANEAAILAGRRNKTAISDDEFEEAKNIVIMGSEKRIKNMKEEDRKITALHEAGHALLYEIHPEIDSVTRVSIVPRDEALGLTWHQPDEDKYHTTKHELLLEIQAILGGRAAEINIYGEDYMTTGASADIRNITAKLRNMVMKWGMSKEMGSIYYGGGSFHKNLGYYVGNDVQISQETQNRIDKEIKDLADKMLSKACKKLKNHKLALLAIADALLEKETLTGDEVKQIIEYCNSSSNLNEGNKKEQQKPGDTWEDLKIDVKDLRSKEN